MQTIKGTNVLVRDSDIKRREAANRAYLMKLSSDNLLLNYRVEAGRFHGRVVPADAHGGWESPVCQLRGHFLGHWLSAAALHYEATGDKELKAKLEYIIDELAACQHDNGGRWIGPIPEKYLHWIANGKSVWAPQYNLHKLLMGLVDAHRYAGNEQALKIADRFADWFVDWSGQFSREQFDDILDVETGGMLEVWADLLHLTRQDKYRTLLDRYNRNRLFEPLLVGRDPLTNMHANTTIPEVLGCARAYEVTGEPRWMAIVKAYWQCAVTDRGTLATGGQTAGEVWMPKQKMKARLGDKNQEHCTVYNMIRLAEFLFRHSGDPAFMQYIEYNLYNGIMAQAYYQEYFLTGNKHNDPSTGLLTYFLPMKAGLRKDWSTETDSFFCCHGTMVQANAAWKQGLYYVKDDSVYVCQYFDSEMKTTIGGLQVRIHQNQDRMSGSMLNSSNTAGHHAINDMTVMHENMPAYRKHDFMINISKPQAFELNLRIPDWIRAEAQVYVNGELHGATKASEQFYVIQRSWEDGDRVSLLLPIGIQFVPLPDDANMGAFRYGPDVLAGIGEAERILYVDNEDIASEIELENEREWGSWRYFFKTVQQDPVIQLRRIRDIGYEPYQIYFKLKRLS
ncbi:MULTISPECIES: beta-L-arabinofuranosidase domain-containing protein [Paenibacillus]|uniref:beta-L-arabinofuranosidase domain-containing protein n=1 Tax=Paenibacillus TaxID=44249 RepID=UPI00203F8A9E|nr:beta-L-arabinofuranosidase domain-containing protein [Paenibacillus camelliae]MCM3636012.1 glycoside hydrolase family 127 protein [Paenibacillus camelliae]